MARNRKEVEAMERWYTVKHSDPHFRLTVGNLSAESGGVVAVKNRTENFYSVRPVELRRSEAFALAAILSHMGCTPRVVKAKGENFSAVRLFQSESAELFARAARIENKARTDAP